MNREDLIMADKITKKDDALYFKGRPLVRSDKTIYYGDPGDDFVALLNITATEKSDIGEMATKVIVQCIATDPTISPKDRIVKRAERAGLFPALQIASIWLNRTDDKK